MDPFKICGNCGQTWQVREDFIRDPEVELVGLQADVTRPENGFYLFNHGGGEPPCNSTLAERVGIFQDLLSVPAHPESRHGEEECEGHCLRIADLERCRAPCSNAAAREVAQILRRHGKEAPR